MSREENYLERNPHPDCFREFKDLDSRFCLHHSRQEKAKQIDPIRLEGIGRNQQGGESVQREGEFGLKRLI